MKSFPTPQFQLDASAPEPLYRQLIAQVHRFIASGALKAGTELPSVRELAEAFAINPMTVSKAYSALEAQGLLLRPRGARMVVAQMPATRSAAERVNLLRPQLLTLIRQAQELGLSAEEIMDALRLLMQEQEP
jgi:GntR family transcriptional regulator